MRNRTLPSIGTVGWALLIMTTLSIPVAQAQVIAFEGIDQFPESCTPPWTRVGTFDATRTLIENSLMIDVDLGVWAPTPGGEQDAYRRNIPEFAGAPRFFVQWRCSSSAPNSEIPGTGGSVINSVGGAATYHFTITRDLVQFWRGNSVPIIDFPIALDLPHTYRVECMESTQYAVYLDGALIDAGIPVAVFPTASARIIWGANMWNTPSINIWDYVRYGVIPQEHSGDFNNNGTIDDTDLYYFVDCLLGPDYDAAGPGCKWADLNADGKADAADIQAFANAMLGG